MPRYHSVNEVVKAYLAYEEYPTSNPEQRAQIVSGNPVLKYFRGDLNNVSLVYNYFLNAVRPEKQMHLKRRITLLTNPPKELIESLERIMENK